MTDAPPWIYSADVMIGIINVPSPGLVAEPGGELLLRRARGLHGIGDPGMWGKPFHGRTFSQISDVLRPGDLTTAR